ncbi:MAG: OmpA family protein [Cyclobacteriaceae bacterium]|nr:OmpA family protein [Cyclobacteriaceae bacterium]MDW8330660.1 OmpA family protein [Cyclobacteriaceae bacterium]
MRSVLIFLTVTGAWIGSWAQNNKELAKEYMTQAELIMAETRAIDDARELMVTAANLDPDNLKANFEAGQYHIRTINKERAVQFFLRVYERDPNYRFDLEFWIGQSYQYGLEFDKAIEFYNRYKDKMAKRPNYMGNDRVSAAVVDRAIYECQNGKEFVANPKNFSIVNIGREINSEWDDYAPVLNANEDIIIFTTRRREGNMNQNVDLDNKPFEDVFISKKVNGVWTRAENIGSPVNTPYHDSNLAFSADGETLFLYKDDNGGDIYYSDRLPNGTWSEPKPLPGIINSSYEEKSISISPDEKTLYFSSNRPGGYGGLDIYKATKDAKGEWGNVKNLGPKINTEYDDDGPFIDYDNKTLYFSSKGRKGMGGFDIFKAVFDEKTNEWSEPENLGYPINTPDNDIYYTSTRDGKRAYYSSVREDGIGYDDIYMITVPAQPVATVKPEEVKPEPKPEAKPETKPEPKPQAQPKFPLRYVVRVVDASTGQPLNARVRLQGARDNIVVAGTAKETGVTEFIINTEGAKDYRLAVEQEGYAFVNQNVRLPGAGEQERTEVRTVELRKLTTGVVGVLRNIYFDFDKATFRTESYTELNKLERMMAENPNLKVEIAGHTDNIGTAAYNMQLSQRRAEAVKDYLVKKGIDPRRVVAKGYGKTRPLASNDDEKEGRELNRRVEFRVIEN